MNSVPRSAPQPPSGFSKTRETVVPGCFMPGIPRIPRPPWGGPPTRRIHLNMLEQAAMINVIPERLASAPCFTAAQGCHARTSLLPRCGCQANVQARFG